MVVFFVAMTACKNYAEIQHQYQQHPHLATCICNVPLDHLLSPRLSSHYLPRPRLPIQNLTETGSAGIKKYFSISTLYLSTLDLLLGSWSIYFIEIHSGMSLELLISREDVVRDLLSLSIYFFMMLEY